MGYGVIRRLVTRLPVEIVSSYAEHLPLADASADIVYMRQVLHHTRDLPAAIAECARVLAEYLRIYVSSDSAHVPSRVPARPDSEPPLELGR